jgi:hypothetical protein
MRGIYNRDKGDLDEYFLMNDPYLVLHGTHGVKPGIKCAQRIPLRIFCSISRN